MSIKKIKNYLWRQDLISRFNPDGKKAKSKGNHIWNVDAKNCQVVAGYSGLSSGESLGSPITLREYLS